MNAVMRFFLSITTAVVGFSAFIGLAFAGSLYLVKNLAFFSGIDETPLFRWLSEAGSVRVTWWIYLMIAVLGLLAINTIFCAVNALLKRTTWKNGLLKLSPEVMHAGVLFIMLGHLLTASVGFKVDLIINKGEDKAVTPETILTVSEVRLKSDAAGYASDWEAEVQWRDAGKQAQFGVLRPVHPLYFGQYGLYIKAVTLEPEPSAQIRICRDPGAVWAGLGGLLLAAGSICFLYARNRSL